MSYLKSVLADPIRDRRRLWERQGFVFLDPHEVESETILDPYSVKPHERIAYHINYRGVKQGYFKECGFLEMLRDDPRMQDMDYLLWHDFRRIKDVPNLFNQ